MEFQSNNNHLAAKTPTMPAARRSSSSSRSQWRVPANSRSPNHGHHYSSLPFIPTSHPYIYIPLLTTTTASLVYTTTLPCSLLLLPGFVIKRTVTRRSMRFFSIPTLIRNFSLFNLSSIYRPTPAVYKGVKNPLLLSNTTAKSMPTIPFLGALFGTSSNSKDMGDFPYKKSDSEWRAQLSPEQFRIIREQRTENPYTGEFDQHYPNDGLYV